MVAGVGVLCHDPAVFFQCVAKTMDSWMGLLCWILSTLLAPQSALVFLQEKKGFCHTVTKRFKSQCEHFLAKSIFWLKNTQKMNFWTKNPFLEQCVVFASFSFAWKVCIHSNISMYPMYQNFCLQGIFFGLLLMQYYLEDMANDVITIFPPHNSILLMRKDTQ